MYFILSNDASYVLASHGWVHLTKLAKQNHSLVVCTKISTGSFLAQLLSEEMKRKGIKASIQLMKIENFKKKYALSDSKYKINASVENFSVTAILEQENARYILKDAKAILSNVSEELLLSQLVLPTDKPAQMPKKEEQPVIIKKKRSFFSRLFGETKQVPVNKVVKAPPKEEVTVTEPPKKPAPITKLTSHSSLADSYAFVKIIEEMSNSFDALDKLVSLGTAKMYSEALSKVEQQINDELHFIEFADLEAEDFDPIKTCARLQELRLERRLVKDNTELSHLVRAYINNEKSAEIKKIAQKTLVMKSRKYKVRDPEHFQH